MKDFVFKIFLVVIITLPSSCSKDRFDIDNLNHNTIMILGHRGMGEGYKYPDNSAKSILTVLGIGADGSEVDVQMTKDSVLVLFHDEYLDDLTTHSGRVINKTWEELADCVYDSESNKEPLISVEELFTEIGNVEDYYFSFDCKLSPNVHGTPEHNSTFLRAIERINQRYNMSDNIFIEGDEEFLLLARQIGLKNKGCLVRAITKSRAIDIAEEHGFFSVGFSFVVDEELVDRSHDLGIRVMVWSPNNSYENKRAVNRNVDIIQTDAPIPILKQLNRFNYEYDMP